MSDSLGRRAVARAAAHLNLAGWAARALPPLVLLTDDRLSSPLGAAMALPRGSIVIARARDDAARAGLVASLLRISSARGLVVLVASDPELATRSGADGLHLGEARIREIGHWRALRPHWLITSAAHSLAALARCANADAVLLAPVFETESHAGGPCLTPVRANVIARLAPVPVYALGGVNAVNARLVNGSRYAGLAAVSALAV